MAGVVFGKEGCSVNVESQKIADGVLIFGAVEATEGFGAAGIGMAGVGFIKGTFQIGEHGFVGAVIRTFFVGGRHLAGTETTNDFLPAIGMTIDLAVADAFEVEIAL